jgi:hypothetical protein
MKCLFDKHFKNMWYTNNIEFVILNKRTQTLKFFDFKSMYINDIECFDSKSMCGVFH